MPLMLMLISFDILMLIDTLFILLRAAIAATLLPLRFAAILQRRYAAYADAADADAAYASAAMLMLHYDAYFRCHYASLSPCRFIDAFHFHAADAAICRHRHACCYATLLMPLIDAMLAQHAIPRHAAADAFGCYVLFDSYVADMPDILPFSPRCYDAAFFADYFSTPLYVFVVAFERWLPP